MASIKTVQDAIDAIPLLNVSFDEKPTTAKAKEEIPICNDQLGKLQELQALVEKYYSDFRAEATKESAELLRLKPDYPLDLYNFFAKKIQDGVEAGELVYTEITRVVSVKDMSYIKMVYAKLADYGRLTAGFNTFEEKILKVEEIAAEIKREGASAVTNRLVTNKLISKDEIATLPLRRTLYDFQLYCITPTGERIALQQYISQSLYTVEYDVMNSPVYSMILKTPKNIIDLVKSQTQNIRWFMTINKYTRVMENNQTGFDIPLVVVDNEEMIAVDPEYSDIRQTSLDGESESLPLYPLRIDFIPKKTIQVNGAVASGVYNNVKVLDVITMLCDQYRAEYEKTYPDKNKSLSFSIIPPDNTYLYEQILVEPGTFIDSLHALQAKYGIYSTGLRVDMDSGSISNDESVNDSESIITILDKGGNAPPRADTVTDVLLELVDPSQVIDPIYQSGSYINKETNTLIIRTLLPYEIIRNSSEAIVNGESIRVMQSSADDHTVTACDSVNTSDSATSRAYWSKYDNAFTSSQLQDSIKEKDLTIIADIRDVDFLSLNDNLKYTLKFYGRDDELFSGEYRLVSIRMYNRNSALTDGRQLEPVAVLVFSDMSKIAIAGSLLNRPSYGDRLTSAAGVYASGQYEQVNMDGTKVSVTPSANLKSAPYPTNFAGRQDYYGVTIPDAIPDDYRMSDTVLFRDIYQCKDGTDLGKANALANNFAAFINAQRYSKEVLDFLNGMFPPLGAGKLNSFFRYSLPAGGSKTSHHFLALATDAVWGRLAGEPLAHAAVAIARSGLVFDQLILEGNGAGWRWIHVGKVMNGTNRQLFMIAENFAEGNYKRVDLNKVSGGGDLYFTNKVFRKSLVFSAT